MVRFRRRGQDGLPRTLLGRSLRATVLRQPDEHARVQAELRRTGWVDLEAMCDAAFRAAVRRYFRPEAAARDIPPFVQDVQNNGYLSTFPRLEAEAMIRRCLGEEVDVSGIDIELATSIQVLTFVAVNDARRSSERELDRWICEIEDAVFAAGYSPTLAERAERV
jgi:hypothetical protein